MLLHFMTCISLPLSIVEPTLRGKGPMEGFHAAAVVACADARI